ncbi:Serine/threonine-protein kinase brsk1 [Tritrichomonas musculus]|uniref:Serine/threonine-protein kinase brsk1 n=1 Tax=Tritrichomonas musculus TaxID=1915356 RepID=A0ABR2JZ17_9EUKA
MEAQQQEIGPFLLIKTLGIGTTGKVKLAINQETKQQVAIKIITKTTFQQRPNLQVKIQREIALMRLVEHSHLLKLVDVLESPRHLYIVLEYASKGELFDFLVEHRRLKEDIALKFFRQIIYGLEYLHTLGICHRDLKPENILLDDQYNIKIADFGFAKYVKSSIAETSCGSPHYAAPEVIRGEPYDGCAADVWSCGVILYALLAGYLPFDDQSIRNLLAKVKKGVFSMPQFPEPIKELIHRMLTLDPKQRITLAQIKSHPCFRWGLPQDYVLPSPLPNPSFNDPIPPESVAPEVFDLLKKIGYNDADELSTDFATPGHTMAKVFYFMLTSQISLEQLQWDSSIGGVSQGTIGDSESENDLQNVNSSDSGMMILLDPSQTSYSIGATSSDPFHRHAYPVAGTSLESVNSVAIQAEWAIQPQQPIIYEQTHLISCPSLNITMAMYGVQLLMRQFEMQWFHPDDETIICRHHQQNLYVVIQGQDSTEQAPTAIQLQLCSGTQESFSVLVRGCQEVLNALTAKVSSGE